jgi:hypothetical protein
MLAISAGILIQNQPALFLKLLPIYWIKKIETGDALQLL